MESYDIDKKYAVSYWTNTTGTQNKYAKDGYWYKENCLGNEGLAEQLASDVLECSNVSNFVRYKQCKINNKNGCVSADFLKKGERFISFQELHWNYKNSEFADAVRLIDSPKDRLTYIQEFVFETTGLDCYRYMQENLALDMLIKNPDRHFGNLGVVLNENGEFHLAPIFDNGQGLYQNMQITPPFMTASEKDAALSSATISGSFEIQVATAGNVMEIDYEKLFAKLDLYPESVAKKCLVEQLTKYQKLFQMPGQDFQIPEKYVQSIRTDYEC